jgi:hypothetical protein
VSTRKQLNGLLGTHDNTHLDGEVSRTRYESTARGRTSGIDELPWNALTDSDGKRASDTWPVTSLRHRVATNHGDGDVRMRIYDTEVSLPAAEPW